MASLSSNGKDGSGLTLGGDCCSTIRVRISGDVLPSSQGEDGSGLTTGGSVMEQLRYVFWIRTLLLQMTGRKLTAEELHYQAVRDVFQYEILLMGWQTQSLQ